MTAASRARSGGPTGLRIAVLKPDFGVVGGFEAVADRIESRLRLDGHDVTRLEVHLPSLATRPFGIDIPPEVVAAVPDYVRYLTAMEAVARLPTRRYDAVISTQPPSFHHEHPRHLSIFFHHQRIFYELEDLWVAAGFPPDADLHREAGRHIRALDAPRLDAVSWFAAGSESVRRRLARFNGIDRASLFHAGVDPAIVPRRATPDGGAPTRDGPVLCVGRLEFPKRTELVVAAMKRLPHRTAAIAGSGGRLDRLRGIDHDLSRPGVDLDAVDETALWCSTGSVDRPAPDGWSSNVEVLGRVSDDHLRRLYATTPCVVAPALDEDYGLTAIEAMAHGAPVVVCHDGGGLADLVEDGVDGLVVEPTGAAIAGAVERILGDADLAAHLAAGAASTAARTTWVRADDEIRTALALACDEEPPAALAEGPDVGATVR